MGSQVLIVIQTVKVS